MDMVSEVVRLRMEVERLRGVVSRMVRFGTIDDVSGDMKRARLLINDPESGEKFLSPWRPWATMAGEINEWSAPSKGQQMALIAAGGRLEQSFMVPATWSNAVPSPSSDLNETVRKAFGVEQRIKDGTYTIKGNLIVEGNIDFRGGYVRHNDIRIDSGHVHGGVLPGSADTNGPH